MSISFWPKFGKVHIIGPKTEIIIIIIIIVIITIVIIIAIINAVWQFSLVLTALWTSAKLLYIEQG